MIMLCYFVHRRLKQAGQCGLVQQCEAHHDKVSRGIVLWWPVVVVDSSSVAS